MVGEGTIMRWNARARVAEAVPGTLGLPFPGAPPALAGIDGSILYGVSSRGSGWIDLAAPVPTWAETNLPGYTNVRLVFDGDEGYAITSTSVARRMPDHSFVHVADIGFEAQDALIHDGRLLVTSGSGLLASDDGGLTWSAELAVRSEVGSRLAGRGSDLFMASLDGLWVRRGSAAWQEIEVHSHIVYRVLPVGEALITFGGHATLVRQRADTAWRPLELDGLYRLTAVGDVLFARSSGGVLQRSTDAGLSFEARPTALGATHFLTELDGALVVLLDDSFYESTDGGETFIELGAAPRREYNGHGLVRVGDVLLYSDGPDVFRSGDRGRTWERAAAAPAVLLNATAVGGAIFVTDWSGGLSRSTDLAGTWTGITLPSEGDRAISIQSDGDVLFAAIQHADAFEGGVYYTRDLGETWQRLDSVEDPFTELVTALTLDGDVLYIGTAGTGLWAARFASPAR